MHDSAPNLSRCFTFPHCTPHLALVDQRACGQSQLSLLIGRGGPSAAETCGIADIVALQRCQRRYERYNSKRDKVIFRQRHRRVCVSSQVRTWLVRLPTVHPSFRNSISDPEYEERPGERPVIEILIVVLAFSGLLRNRSQETRRLD